MDRLGLGLGLVVPPGLVGVLGELEDRVDAYEIEPQTYWLPTGDIAHPWRPGYDVLDAVTGRGRPVLAHGVGAAVGGAGAPDPLAVGLFADGVRAAGAVLASEHLSFNRAAVGDEVIDTGLFLPPCPSEEGVERAIAAVIEHKAALGVPFSVETGVNYLRPRRDELPDAEIVARVAEGADCGILADLHNLWCNQRNGREHVLDALARLPLERVTEVHLAGGTTWNGWYLDGHSGLVADELVEITARVLPLLPNVEAVVFEIGAPHLWRIGLDALAEHLATLGRLVDEARRAPLRRPPNRPPRARPATAMDPERWEAALASAATGWPAPSGGAVIEDPAVPLLRHLVDSGRDSRVLGGARTTVRLLLLALGAANVDEVLACYRSCRVPALSGWDEASRFLDWLPLQALDVPRLQDAVALDQAGLAAARTGRAQRALLDGDPTEIIESLDRGVLPPAGRCRTLMLMA